MELRDALSQIREVRLSVSRTGRFRELRSFPTALTGFFALGAGALQSRIVADPLADTAGWVGLWFWTAALSAVVVGATILPRLISSNCSIRKRSTRDAVVLFLPAVVVGATLTWALPARDPALVSLLPGLWQIVYGLGMLSVSRVLPRAVASVGWIYLVSGLHALTLTDAEALAPWTMAAPFVLGQALCAVALYWKLERQDVD